MEKILTELELLKLNNIGTKVSAIKMQFELMRLKNNELNAEMRQLEIDHKKLMDEIKKKYSVSNFSFNVDTGIIEDKPVSQ